MEAEADKLVLNGRASKSSRDYYEFLGVLRVLCVAMVYFCHAEQFKFVLKVPNQYMEYPVVSILPGLSLVLLFVLSGFLIGIILSSNSAPISNSSIKLFYKKRIQRILPTYFLTLFIVVVLAPKIAWFQIPNFPLQWAISERSDAIILCLLILPNLVYANIGIMPFFAHSWTVATEWYFYAAVPYIFRLKRKKRLFVLLSILMGLIVLKISLSLFYDKESTLNHTLRYFDFFSVFIGCLFGIVKEYLQRRWVPLILKQIALVVSLVILITLFISNYSFTYFHKEIYAVLFGVFILYLSSINLIWLKRFLEFSRIDVVCYEFYMFHPMCIAFSLYILNKHGIFENWIFYILGVSLTVVLAYFVNWFFRKVLQERLSVFAPKLKKVFKL